MKIFNGSKKDEKEKLLASNPKLQEIIKLMKKADDIDESMIPHEFATKVSSLLNSSDNSNASG